MDREGTLHESVSFLPLEHPKPQDSQCKAIVQAECVKPSRRLLGGWAFVLGFRGCIEDLWEKQVGAFF